MTFPEILDADTEREILISRLADRVEHAWRAQLRPGAEPFDLSATAVTAMVGALRVLSTRQLAVLLAGEANRHEEHVIHEPPQYTAGEIEDAS